MTGVPRPRKLYCATVSVPSASQSMRLNRSSAAAGCPVTGIQHGAVGIRDALGRIVLNDPFAKRNRP